MPTKGYSFATWLRIEEAPRLSNDGSGGGGGGGNNAAEHDRALYTLLARGPAGTKGVSSALRGEPEL